jgi:hypothetical protein
MNLQLLEPVIAPHTSGTRQWCASRSVWLVISLFAVWPFATAAFALDPQKSITQFAHTVWTEKDGAPADVVAITQTSDGYLWLGTWTGLFYRLNVFPVHVPPLRERRDDIAMLLEYFLHRYAKQARKEFKSIDKYTLDFFEAYDWPGNIRELQNIVERSVILSPDDVFCVDNSWLPSIPCSQRSPQTREDVSDDDSEHERKMIVSALTQPWANIWAERRGGGAWIAPFDIGSSHQEAEYSQEPIQARLIVKRIRHILCFPRFHKIRTASSSLFFCIFNHFTMAFYMHSLKRASIHAMLAGKARDDMQSRSTDRPRPFSSASHKRPSSRNAHKHDRRPS